MSSSLIGDGALPPAMDNRSARARTHQAAASEMVVGQGHDLPAAPLQGQAGESHRRWPTVWPLAALLAGVTALAVLYMAQTPPYEGADSDAHFRYVAFLRREPRRPTVDAATAAISHELIQQPPLYYVLAAVATLPFPLQPALDLYRFNPHYPEYGPRSTISPPNAPPGAEWPLRLAAGVSLLGALLTVLATWGLARELAPRASTLAFLAAATVGLNPQFLFAAATVTNDTWIAATFALCVWAALRAARDGRNWRGWLGVGLLASLTMLTKYTGLAVLAVVGVVWVASVRRVGWRHALPSGLALGLAVGLGAGWWYAFNLVHYGSLVPFDRIQAILATHARTEPLSLSGVIRKLGWLWRTFWGVLGYGVVAPPWFFRLLDVLTGLAAVGLALLPVRLWRERRRGDGQVSAASKLVGLCLLWLAPVMAGLMHFMRWVAGGNQGRLLFPAAPAVAGLLAVGWWALAPRRRERGVVALLVAVLAMFALGQVLTLAQAYAMPRRLTSLPQPHRPVEARFQAGMTLVGADLPKGGSVESGGELPLVLYWRAERVISPCRRVFIQLVGSEDRLLAAYDGVPYGGRHPTCQWRPGETFADPYKLQVATVLTESVGLLIAGFYDPASGKREVLLDAHGDPVDDRVALGHVAIRLVPALAALEAEPLARWQNGIELVNWKAKTSDPNSGAPMAVLLEWQARRPVHQDLTVFVQLLDMNDRVVRQDDRRPLGDGAPTDTWVPGYRWRSEHPLTGGPATDWDRLIVGFYDWRLERLALDVEGQPVDHFVLVRRRTSGAAVAPADASGRVVRSFFGR